MSKRRHSGRAARLPSRVRHAHSGFSLNHLAAALLGLSVGAASPA